MSSSGSQSDHKSSGSNDKVLGAEELITSDQKSSGSDDKELDAEQLITLAVLEKRRQQKKRQPWKGVHAPRTTDIPTPGNVHDKPYYYLSESDRGGKSQTA